MSNEVRFNLVIAGELVPGAAPEAVKNNLATLLKLPAEKAQVLLATKPRILQKNIDQATAMKWRAALQRAGLKSSIQQIEPTTPKEATVTQEQQALPQTATQAPESRNKNIEMIGTIRTGGDEFTGPFEVAAVGADIADPKEELSTSVPSIEHLSMAPVGADIETLQEEQQQVSPDISHLSYS